MTQSKINELISTWRSYCSQMGNWQKQIEGTEPILTGCGPVYELGNPLGRPNEDLAIADMREVDIAEPHYHPDDNWEFYLVLQGKATVVVGDQQHRVNQGDVVPIPPDTAHFTIPDDNFVIATINTPPFKPEIYIKLTDSNPAVHFDREQFDELTQ